MEDSFSVWRRPHSLLLGASWWMCSSSTRLCRPVLGYCSGGFQRVLDSLDKNRTLQCQYSCAGSSHQQWKAYSSSSMWAHPSSPWAVFTQVFSPPFSHLSGKFCSRFLSKWNRIAFLNPNKLLHNLVYLTCTLCQKYPQSQKYRQILLHLLHIWAQYV